MPAMFSALQQSKWTFHLCSHWATKPQKAAENTASLPSNGGGEFIVFDSGTAWEECFSALVAHSRLLLSSFLFAGPVRQKPPNARNVQKRDTGKAKQREKEIKEASALLSDTTNDIDQGILVLGQENIEFFNPKLG